MNSIPIQRTVLGLLLLAWSGSVHSFAPVSPVSLQTPSGKVWSSSSSVSQLSMLPPNLFGSLLDAASQRKDSHSTTKIELPMFLGSAAPFGLTSLTLGSSVVASAVEGAPINPNVEAQILNDVAHVGLDLASFLGPGILVLRLSALIGRLASVGADMVSDHLLVDEIIYQAVMVTVAWVGLVKAAMPSAFAALAKNVTLRDGKAFAALFAPAGTSWTQFKALSVCALDWITVEEGELVTTDEKTNNDTTRDDDHLYWLYSGNVRVESNGTTLYNVNRHGTENAGRGLLGEGRLLRRMERRKSSKKNAPEKSAAASHYPRTTVRANSKSTLLRIHMPNLKILMDNDQTLADSIRTLLFQGMEAKLNAHLLPELPKHQEQPQASTVTTTF